MDKLTASGIALLVVALLVLPAQARQGTFTITGTITSNGQGVPDIPLVLSGTQSDTTTTNQNGEYQFGDLSAGSYTVTPEHDSYTFAPESHSISFPGSGTPVPVFEATMTTATGTDSGGQVPASLFLEQNYPNPFNPITTIRYRVAEAGWVHLEVVDALGRSVAVLVDDQHSVGAYAVAFNAGALPSGVYLYRLRDGASVRIRAMTLAK